MKYLVTAEEMKIYDHNTMEEIGISGDVLMERAALETFRILQEKGLVSEGGSAFLLVGYGNNGGDGLVLARLLAQAGLHVEIYPAGDSDRATPLWKKQAGILTHFPVTYVTEPCRETYDIVVDALFGVGLSRPLTGKLLEAVEVLNALKGFKVACDIPSGISSDTGKAMGGAVRCDLTVTYGFEKRGLYLYPGRSYTGECRVAQIGIGREAFLGREPEMFYLEDSYEELFPPRNEQGNKGTFGKALIIAGSLQMAGAAILSATACYRSGAGMVKLLSPMENRVILQQCIPEALLGTYDDLEESLEWCDVICIGPGLGTSREAAGVLRRVLEEDKPLLIDADGINLLCKDTELLKIFLRGRERERQVVLTPHMGELLRLWRACHPGLDLSMDQLKERIIPEGRELAEILGAVLAAKDAVTLIFQPGGQICMNLTGNSGMATAGSGDVLSGIITAFLAQGVSPFSCACRGVRLHGMAGDRVAGRLGEPGLMAGDLVREL